MQEAPLLAVHLPKSCTIAITCIATTNHHLTEVERNGVQRKTKVSFGRTIMQALELQWLAKWHVSGQSNTEQ